MGHASLATTQGYAAIYPKDVIRHHRTFIEKRRVIRPTEEYREPTAAEWDEFEAHFVQRKLSLGSCGRAYGTGCQDDPAMCNRCARQPAARKRRPTLDSCSYYRGSGLAAAYATRQVREAATHAICGMCGCVWRRPQPRR